MNDNYAEKADPSYKEDQAIYVAVDSIIFGIRNSRLNLLLFEREVEPLAGEWSLIGSFVGNSENVDEAAKRVLHELTGLKDLFMEQLHCFGNSDRDPGGRVISIAYWSLIKIDFTNFILDVSGHRAKWVEFNNVPNLILDHGAMVQMAIKQLREKARFHPIGFELLPKEFTMLQLLGVYEAIFDTSIDDRNFRKKILNSGLLIDLKKKDMTTSKKGSFLYCFDQKRYDILQRSGFNFDFNF